MTKAELIARLEAATADDAGLMQEAWLAIYGPEPASGYGPRSDPPFCPKWEAYIKARCRFRNLLQAEAYESAALTLVPANALWGVKALWDQGPDANGGPKAYRGSVDVYEVRDGLFWKDNYLSLAPTPALAIAIAALKARP